jgi:DNA repair exonuclease SbcCD ATPase subunit
MEENRNLSAKMEEKEAIEGELRAEIERLTAAQVSKTYADGVNNSTALDALQDQLEKLSNEHTFLKEHAHRLEETLLEKDNELEQLEVTRSQEEASLKADIDQLNDKLQKLAAELSKSREQSQVNSEIVTSLQTDLESIRVDNDKLQALCERLKGEKDEALQRLKDELSVRLETATKGLVEKENELLSLQSQFDELSLSTSNSVAEQEAEIQRLLEEKKNLSDMLSSASADNDQVKSLVEENRRLSDVMNATRDERRKEIENLKDEYTSEIDALKWTIAENESRLSELEQQLENAHESHRTEREKAIEEVQSLHARIEKLQNASSSAEAYAAELESLKAENANLVEEKNTLVSQLDDLEEQLHTQNEVNDKLSMEYKQSLESRQAEISERDSEVEVLNEKLQNLLASFKSESELRSAAESAINHQSDMSEVLNQKDHEISELRNQMAESEESGRNAVEALRVEVESTLMKMRSTEKGIADVLHALAESPVDAEALKRDAKFSSEVNKALHEITDLIINLQSKSSGDGMADGGGKFWNEHCVYR